MAKQTYNIYQGVLLLGVTEAASEEEALSKGVRILGILNGREPNEKERAALTVNPSTRESEVIVFRYGSGLQFAKVTRVESASGKTSYFRNVPAGLTIYGAAGAHWIPYTDEAWNYLTGLQRLLEASAGLVSEVCRDAESLQRAIRSGLWYELVKSNQGKTTV